MILLYFLEELCLEVNPMGADIHAHIEIKVDNVWHHYTEADIHRWYRLFGAMAGVRGEDKCLVYPKGLPKDITLVTKLDYDQFPNDRFSPSWFGLKDLKKLESWLEKVAREMPESTKPLNLEGDILHRDLFTEKFTILLEEDHGRVPACIQDVRLVFWFDN